MAVQSAFWASLHTTVKLIALCKFVHDATRAGTDADLRRLGHKRAGELLMTKFGMDADTVAGLARWDRIDAIRRWGLWALQPVVFV